MTAPWDEPFETIVRSFLPLHPDDLPLTGDLSLTAAGLDSLGVVELLFQLEEQYDVRFRDEEVHVELFATPNSVWRMISELRAATGA